MIAPSIAVNTVVDGYEIHMSGKKFEQKTIAWLRELANREDLFMDSKESAVGMYRIKKEAFK